MSTTDAISRRWRIPFVLAGIAMIAGGPLHPEGDAEDSLRGELATMTAGDTWVLSHSLLALGTALLAYGLWCAHRSGAWPASVRRSLHVVAITMSLYVVETIFHLASVVDTQNLADGELAPVAFAHIGLALVLYPLSGLTFAWMNLRLFRAVPMASWTTPVVGIAAGVLQACSVPLTVVFPDTEFTQVFASAVILLALWSLLIGFLGVKDRHASTTTNTAPGSPNPDAPAIDPQRAGAYRQAEHELWQSLGAEPTERQVTLPRLGAEVRVQELGEGEPVVFVHGGPSTGTAWAPLAARLDGFRVIVVDRPGTGLSAPHPVAADGVDEFAEVFVIDLLDGLGLDRAHVVASSFGGFLSLRAAAVAPNRFARMVQLGCPAGAPGMVVPPFMRATASPMLRRLITSLPPNERAARSVLRQLGHGVAVDEGRLSAPYIDWYLALQRDTDTMRNDMALMGSLVTRRGALHPSLSLDSNALAAGGVPTLWYWGDADPFGGLDVADRVLDAVGGVDPGRVELEVVGDGGHLPWLDDPERAARSVERFLRAGSTVPNGDRSLVEHG